MDEPNSRLGKSIDEAKLWFLQSWPWFYDLWREHVFAQYGATPSSDRLLQELPDEPFEQAISAFLRMLSRFPEDG